MYNRIFFAILFVLLFSDIAISNTTVSSTNKIPVLLSIPQQYSTIQEAINAANPGDTVLVSAGVYYEHVIVNKSISLVGENRNATIIDGNGTGNVVLVMVDDVSVSGFTIRNGTNGIFIDGDNSSVINNVITFNEGNVSVFFSGNGIVLNHSSHAKIYENVITNNGGSIPGWSWGMGIECFESSHNVIFGNTILSNKVGGIGVFGHFNVVEENNITNNGGDGISIVECTNNTVIYNRVISNSNTGISLIYSDCNIVKNNRVSENGYWDMGPDPKGGGILLGWSSGNVIEENLVWDNVNFGIALNDLNPDNIVRGNAIIHNRNGIYFHYSNDTTVYHNNFINNTVQASVGDAYNDIELWDNGAEGNYWSHLSGEDTNLDGIIDIPYVLDVRNQDNYPLVEPWSETRTFPIVWDEVAYNVTTYCNSTVASLHFNQPDKLVGFNITGPAGSITVCNVTIPLTLMYGYFSVLINDIPQPYAIYQNQTHTSTYFTIPMKSTMTVKIHSTEVIPEFPETTVLTMFMIATLLSAVLLKRRQLRQRRFYQKI
jgi:nitrous oxidase accessory protein